jgi:hypothetical protein
MEILERIEVPYPQPVLFEIEAATRTGPTGKLRVT